MNQKRFLVCHIGYHNYVWNLLWKVMSIMLAGKEKGERH